MLHRPVRKIYLIAVILGCLTTILTIGFRIAEAHAERLHQTVVSRGRA